MRAGAALTAREWLRDLLSQSLAVLDLPMLLRAHRAIESLTLDREVAHLKDALFEAANAQAQDMFEIELRHRHG